MKAAGKKKWMPKRKTLLPNIKTGTGREPCPALKVQRTRKLNPNEKLGIPD
jgi:hypothetical protein